MLLINSLLNKNLNNIQSQIGEMSGSTGISLARIYTWWASKNFTKTNSGEKADIEDYLPIKIICSNIRQS